MLQASLDAVDLNGTSYIPIWYSVEAMCKKSKTRLAYFYAVHITGVSSVVLFQHSLYGQPLIEIGPVDC
jgi:hypothetical protein